MEALTLRSTTGLITKRRDVPRLDALARLLADAPELCDAYDALLGSLRLSAALSSGNTILVTSTLPGEGKTTVAACLALTASLAGYSVLLVDGDLRRPWLATDTVGLGEVLAGVAEPAEVIELVDVFAESYKAGPLRVMASGRRPPAFLPAVDWAKARATFQGVSRSFGLVLIDTPPLMAASDPLLLAGVADAVLLVVGSGTAHRDDVRRAKEQLRHISTPFLGAVLNQLDPQTSGRPGYRGYYRRSRP
jgi:capsular exopolysaccharide synthesis family protein